MRILIHDFAGHPFQLQLSKELARRGHYVLHLYFADLAGPKASFGEEDPNLRILALRTGGVSKYSLISRFLAHRKYEKLVIAQIEGFCPDCVLSGNTPTDIQQTLARHVKDSGYAFFHWVQDFYSVALENVFQRRMGPIGKYVASPFHRMEREIYSISDGVIYISEDFQSYAESIGYRAHRQTVIENWAALDEIHPMPKDNHWSRKNKLHNRFVFLYSGTLGTKHNPELLVALSQRFKSCAEISIVVVTEGLGREFLEKAKATLALDNLILLDFQPYSELSAVFGTSDVVLATLVPDSSIFCVPSKILSYFCSGRPSLISAPKENLIARLVSRAEAGFCVDPADTEEFLEISDLLYKNKHLRRKLGTNARLYAERTFEIGTITDRFLETVTHAMPTTVTFDRVPSTAAVTVVQSAK